GTALQRYTSEIECELWPSREMSDRHGQRQRDSIANRPFAFNAEITAIHRRGYSITVHRENRGRGPFRHSQPQSEPHGLCHAESYLDVAFGWVARRLTKFDLDAANRGGDLALTVEMQRQFPGSHRGDVLAE